MNTWDDEGEREPSFLEKDWTVMDKLIVATVLFAVLYLLAQCIRWAL